MALIPVFLDLGFADSEDFGSAAWTFTLGCGATVLHRYCPGILNIYLFPALHTIGLHRSTSLFSMNDSLFLPLMSIVTHS